jgi:serine/threonine-protein kinase
MNRPEPPPAVVTVEVPYVKGMTQETAAQAIEALGLKSDVIHENGANDDTKGTVTNQDPAAKAQAEKDSVVTIWINDGPKIGTIPSGLIGMEKSAAEQALHDAGFTKFKTDPAPLDRYPFQSTYTPDHIIDCQPAPGSSTTVDTVIQLYYDSGNGILPDISITDRAQDVSAKLARAGFDNVTWQTRENSTAAVGTVLTMDPPSGTTVARTTTVTVWTAVAPTPPPPVETTPPPQTEPEGTPSPSPSPTP